MRRACEKFQRSLPHNCRVPNPLAAAGRAGIIVYQGPRSHVVPFFEGLGFRLPPRKGAADFLQEITSRKEQAVRRKPCVLRA